MTREAWVAILLFPCAAAAIWLNSSIGMMAAAVLALGYLFSQAMILRECRGIPAWRMPQIVPLIVITGLAEGAGIYLAAMASAPSAKTVAMIALVLTALRAWSWMAYLQGLRSTGAPAQAIAVLEAFKPWLLVLGIVLPVVLIVSGWMVPHPFLFAAAGVCIAGAGAALKFILVTRAGYNQGFALAHIPARGAELRVTASGEVKPGWLMPVRERDQAHV
jgi:phenylacetyl-CoA:acceptor oxidoreductase subunit 2